LCWLCLLSGLSVFSHSTRIFCLAPLQFWICMYSR
jgi:hypothetical protein